MPAPIFLQPQVIGALDAPPMLIRTGPVKFVLGVLASLAAIGFSLETIREDPMLARFLLPVIGLAFAWAVFCGWRLMQPDRLELSPAGLRYLTFVGVIVDVPWAQTGPFGLGEYRGAKLVTFNVAYERRPAVRLRDMHRSLTGTDVALPDGWPMGSEKLATLLNDARDRWG